MIGIEFVKDKTTKTPYPELVSNIMTKALKKHLILISCGIHFNVIRLAPALTISKEELSHGLDILCETINDYD